MNVARRTLVKVFGYIERRARVIQNALSVEPPPLEMVELVRPRQLDGACEGCADCQVRGVHWPAVSNRDNSRSWIDRCEQCQRFSSDLAAAEHLLELGLIDRLGLARPIGSNSESFFGEPVEEFRDQKRGRRSP